MGNQLAAIILVLTFFAAAGMAAEVQLGRLSHVDHEKRQLHITGLPHQAVGEELIVSYDEEQYRDWSISRMRTGAAVRVWMEPQATADTVASHDSHQVHRMAPGVGHHHQREDRTGVRSRLGEPHPDSRPGGHGPGSSRGGGGRR
ncbi:hypothetical protein [Desulfurispira natronophila]|uniref:Uncharacterized protein n=1 Tax=Desulfurispira natronophila TaxID=682562 RepID=A0A7W7Y2Q1_9BACT|nr:hypothetical protein [Desulfurispira natronophila]MBB5020844.1 hypothetical protein [Desulfurispira natronophila]